MATTTLTLSDDALLAEYVAIDTFKGLLEQRLAVGPDLLALLIRDGQVAYAAPGGHFAVGGVWQSVKDAVGGQHAMRLLIADLKPFPLVVPIETVTRDHVPVVCEVTIELQVNPVRGANVLGLMKDRGRLTKGSLAGRLGQHLGERVLHAAARRVDALELRGNTGLQDKVQADAMLEVERLAADLGLLVRAVTGVWAANEAEKAKVLERRQTREQETLEREHAILNRSIAREAESTVLTLRTDLDIEKVKAASDGELRRLVLSEELSFVDARESGIRDQQLKALQHELRLNREQRLDALNAQLEVEDQAIKTARLRGDQRGVGREGEVAEGRHAIDLATLGGQRRDVEMDLAVREQRHTLVTTKIRAEIAEVERAIQTLNNKTAREDRAADKYSELDIAARAQADHAKTIRTLGIIEAEVEAAKQEVRLKAEKAAHDRAVEMARLEAETRMAQLQTLKGLSPEQVMALTAGFSPAVANVLIEQARIKTQDGDERLALMREMVAQAQAGRVASEAQAREMFGAGMQGAVGVAHGAGGRADAGRAHAPAAAGETIECPTCQTVLRATDRFCKKCGRAMRQ